MPGSFAYVAATNIVTVTAGTEAAPATFADFVIADRAGTYTLLEATNGADNLTATNAVRPCESLGLKLDFVVAGKTTETDYIHVTGTDQDDIAIGETLDVSAGNGAYTTTLRYKTLTASGIDCNDSPVNSGGTAWADGTVSVVQNQWGVIWDKGNGQYQLDAYFNIGNGTTSTYFADTNKHIVLADGWISSGIPKWIWVRANATLTLGTLDDATDKTAVNGCVLQSKETTKSVRIWADGPMFLYDCRIAGDINWIYLQYYYAGSNHLYHAVLQKVELIMNQVDCHKIDFVSGGYDAIVASSLCNLNEITINRPSVHCMYVHSTGSGTFKNIKATNYTWLIYLYRSTGTSFIIDSYADDWSKIRWDGTGATGSLYRQFTFNLELQDKDGVAQAGKVVKMVNDNGDTVFEETTDANGNITFSGQHSSPESNAVSYKRYYYSGGAQTQDYSPFKLYIDGAHVATYGSDDVELWEANGGANLVGPIGGGGGIKMIREVLHAIA